MDLIDFPYSEREKHLYVPGKTRHGKSTFLMNLAYQDICNGAGVCVLDPKGDLVKHLIHWIPKHRVDDTIYLDLGNPVPIDLMSCENEDEREALVGEIKYLVTQGENVDHAPLMKAVLDDLIHTLLNYNQNVEPEERATFLDIHQFLENENRRKEILRHVSNQRLKHKWDKLPNERTVISITSRLTSFINSASLTKVFGCPNPSLNVADIMDNRKILLVDLGGTTEPKKILGTLLVAKIRQAAFRRANIRPSERVPFFLFVDEFKNFQTSDFDEILSFAGGYGLRLTLANQFVGQLEPKITQSIFGNVSNFVVFCISDRDIPHFRGLFPDYELSLLPKLRPWEALYKIGSVTIQKPTPPPLGYSPESYAESIVKRTMDLYACDTARGRSKESADEEPGQRGKAEDIPPGPEPRVPSHPHKKKNPRTSF